MDIIIDVYSKFVDNENKLFVFNDKEVEMKVSNDFATDNETVFVLALKYKAAFEIFEISQMYFSDYVTIKAKYESVDVRSKKEFDFALERMVMRYM
ncbi:hypothetical protein P3U36_07865 [Staphylococcus pseudintermedius]|uniref:hypothetical protein n=1 Tax=Staphylococcus pseudintermedius TaxID=283734 RepID=UPI002AC91AF2|nr:hypothetical protein [Staphylococcus pseudintermedius]WQL64594.1 hypothetical protein P3U36_07865 [Staphylococcus pseudintermedius]